MPWLLDLAGKQSDIPINQQLSSGTIHSIPIHTPGLKAYPSQETGFSL